MIGAGQAVNRESGGSRAHFWAKTAKFTIHGLTPATPARRRNHRIDAGGAAPGDVAREHGDGGEDGADHHERHRIGWLDLEQQALHEPRQQQRAGAPDHDAGERHDERLLHHHAQHVRLLRAERHPDADLLRPLRDTVRDHAVDPDRRQQERRTREHRQEQHRQPPFGDRVRHHFIHRPDVGDRQLRVERPHQPDDRRDDPAGVAGGSHGNGHRSVRVPRERPVGHRAAFGIEAGVLDVADHADDFVLQVVPGDADTLADRILARPVPERHGLVDDDAAFGVGGIVVAQEPAPEERNAHRPQIVVRDHADVRHGFLAPLRLWLCRRSPSTSRRRARSAAGS